MLQFEIKETDLYGIVSKDNISLDDYNNFENSLILVELYKIKCFINESKQIVGLQTIFRDKNEDENIKEYQSIFIQLDNNSQEQEFIFEKRESIINITIWKNDSLNGFEITTNKHRNFLFGLTTGNKIMLNEFSSENNMVVGLFSKFNYKFGLTALGFYYVNRKEHLIVLYSGLFYLRAKLKDEQFNKYIKNNEANLDYTDKTILKLGLLPKNLFGYILQFLIR